MSYAYEQQKHKIFTEEGQVMFVKIRDNVKRLLAEAGVVRMGNAVSNCGGGDSWDMLACVDRLVELGEIREVEYGDCSGQDRLFVAVRR